jgi:hypothetical protein
MTIVFLCYRGIGRHWHRKMETVTMKIGPKNEVKATFRLPLDTMKSGQHPSHWHSSFRCR